MSKTHTQEAQEELMVALRRILSMAMDVTADTERSLINIGYEAERALKAVEVCFDVASAPISSTDNTGRVFNGSNAEPEDVWPDSI